LSIISLNDLPLNQIGIIDHISSSSKLKRRLLDLGIIKGTKIKPLLKSPFDSPTAFEIRGCLIAIRDDDSKHIYIKKDKEEHPTSQTPPYKWDDEDDPNIYISQR